MFGFGNRQQAPQYKNVWNRTIGLPEFSTDTPDGLIVTAGVWFTWRYRVPAQQVIRLGSGSIQNGVDNRGVLMVDIQEATPVQIAGDATVQLGYENANQTNFVPVWEGRLDQINNPLMAANRLANNVLPETQPGARQDSFLVIRVRPSATLLTAFSDSDSDFRVPVTIYTL
jgi:hypothetical protein